MKARDAKIALFTSLIVAMIIPFSITGDVVAAEPRIDIGETLEQAAPFMHVNEAKMVVVDYAAASDVLDKEQIEFIKEVTSDQNGYVHSLKMAAAGAYYSMDSDKHLESDAIQQLRGYFATMQGNDYSSAGRPSNNGSDCDWGAQGTPDTNEYELSVHTLHYAQQLLEKKGFHQTPAYAAFGYPNPTHPVDHQYNDFISMHGCWDGVFRTEAVIHLNLEKYHTSGPEPNPEIFGYTWPTVFWPTYVHNWHEIY